VPFYSCILFAILLNDLPYYLLEIFVLRLKLRDIWRPDEIDFLLKKLQHVMDIIFDWMKINRMQLNVEKTQIIIIGNPAIVKSIGNVTVEIRGNKITSVNKSKV